MAPKSKKESPDTSKSDSEKIKQWLKENDANIIAPGQGGDVVTKFSFRRRKPATKDPVPTIDDPEPNNS